MDSNQTLVVSGVSSTERFADPCSRRVRRQRSFSGYPFKQFNSVPFTHKANTIVKQRLVSLIAIGCLQFVLASHAQVPGLINYQGRIVDNGTNFNGTGLFEFALVNPGGTTNYWSNDGTAIGQPSAAVSLAVTKGLYSVLLGNTTVSNMTMAVPAAVFANSNVLLRAWFNDGVTGFQQLTPDQRIAAVGYAMMAANVPNGAITSVQLASNAVTAANLAAGAVTTVAIANGAVGANQLAINSINSLIQSNLASTVAGAITNAVGGRTNLASFVNVKTFGATGNGSTDDSIAIQTADIVASSNSQAVYFPQGNYLVHSNLLQNAPMWFGVGNNPDAGTDWPSPFPSESVIGFAGTGACIRVLENGFEFNHLALIGTTTTLTSPVGIAHAPPSTPKNGTYYPINSYGTVGIMVNNQEFGIVQACALKGWDTAVYQSFGSGIEYLRNRIQYNNEGIWVDGNAANTLISGNWIGYNFIANVIIGGTGTGYPKSTQIIGGDGTLWSNSVGVLDNCQGDAQVLIQGVNFEGYPNAAGVIVATNYFNTLMVQNCSFDTYAGTGVNYYAIQTWSGASQGLTTRDLYFGYPQDIGNTNGSVVLNVNPGGLVYDLGGATTSYLVDTVTGGSYPFVGSPIVQSTVLSPIYNAGGGTAVVQGGGATLSSATINSATVTNLSVAGSLALSTTNISSGGTTTWTIKPYNNGLLSATIWNCDTTAGAQSNLLYESHQAFGHPPGLVIIVNNVGANSVVLDAQSGFLIGTNRYLTIQAYGSATIVSASNKLYRATSLMQY